MYHLSVQVASGFNSKARLWINGRRSIFTHLQEAIGSNTAPIVWMHCASLGEFEQGRPLLEAIRKTHPSHKILLTFFSPSGYEVRKNYEGADYIFYLPADSKKNATRLLEITNPQLVLWVKYDYWYYYLSALKQRNIPVLLISGRFLKDFSFFRWYGKLHRRMLECFLHLFVQTEATAELLRNIGFHHNVSVCGDTRFDRVLQIAGRYEPIEGIEEFCGADPVIVAGSTWPEDEEELDHYANTHQDIKFIIAPHEIGEARLKEAEGLFMNCVRYSIMSQESGVRSRPAPSASLGRPKEPAYRPGSSGARMSGKQAGIEHQSPNVLLIDNIGMLSRLYKYATITYVGGGFGSDGIHNVLEAAVYGKPVIFGPAYEKYIEAVDLIEKGAAYSFESAVELEQLVNDMLADQEWLKDSGEAARDYVYNNAGATDAILSFIQVNRLLTS